MTPMKWLTAVLGFLGLLALVAAILYFTIPAHSLPSFLGPIQRVSAHRKRRGEAAIAIAVVLWVVAGIVFYVGRRSAAGPSTSQPATGQPTSDQSAT
jgi:hypothetical protein